MTTKKLKGSSERKFLESLLGGPLTFGNAIEALRGRDELTQIGLAKRLGLSKQYVCDIEKGRRLVSPEQAARFAKAFGHPEIVLVQLALQDSIRDSGLKLKVSVEAA
ncbi:MAG: helix-turn-helix transcriptional regulator [Xanthomonadaceae bacterium]|nr:helix-turn-helix transcriptional regulator [Xanthomonadaceae bacterium]